MNIGKVIAGKLQEQQGEYKKDDVLEHFHPSSAGYCERQIWLRKMGLLTFDTQTLGKMQIGTIVHEWIQNLPEVKEKYAVEKEVKTNVDDTLFFKGKIDLLDKELTHLVDLKIFSGLKYVKFKPMKNHESQVQIYMHASGTKEAKIIYFDKYDLSYVEHTISYDVEHVKEIFQKVKRVYERLYEMEKIEGIKVPFIPCGCFFCKNEKLKPGVIA